MGSDLAMEAMAWEESNKKSLQWEKDYKKVCVRSQKGYFAQNPNNMDKYYGYGVEIRHYSDGTKAHWKLGLSSIPSLYGFCPFPFNSDSDSELFTLVKDQPPSVIDVTSVWGREMYIRWDL